MIKYLFYIDVFKNQGGAQRVMSNVIRYLVSKKNEVVLVVDYDDNSPYYDSELEKKIKIHHLTNKNKGGSLIKNIRKVLRLRQIIRNETPNICISFLGLPNIRLLLSTFGLKMPRVVSVRSDPNKEYGKNSLVRFAINMLFSGATGVIVQTEYVKDYFYKHVQKKCHILYNPVSDSLYDLKRPVIESGIVTFGSLLECKNHIMLIKAFSEVKDDFPDDDLYIYGQGEYKSKLENYISELHLNDRVHLPGNSSNVGAILVKSKVFVLSSNYEGMPNALMEAMATGTPSISTDCPSGGPRTLITTIDEGILVPVDDYKAMAAAMIRMKDGNVRARMSAATKKRAMVFKGEQVLNSWEKYLVSLVGKVNS